MRNVEERKMLFESYGVLKSGQRRKFNKAELHLIVLQGTFTFSVASVTSLNLSSSVFQFTFWVEQVK